MKRIPDHILKDKSAEFLRGFREALSFVWYEVGFMEEEINEQIDNLIDNLTDNKVSLSEEESIL